jgi:signal transduction histidine kinase
MANKFSNFAKVPDATPEAINLKEQILALVSLYKATDFIEINVSDFSPEIHIWMDKVHFSRAVGNIIKNAIQSIPADKQGIINIQVETENGVVIIKVIDNGIGISKEMEPLVFIPNFSTKTSGSGIGLSITKSLLENAGGKILFNSIEGEGTTFEIRLPIYNP